jgi:hypothetical protein
MSEIKTNEFKNYDKIKPETVGTYIWRRTLKSGIVINFKSDFRLRGAGFKKILSPEFDHWDGYKVIVPKNVEWREVEENDNQINVENFEIKSCPFCNSQPTLSARSEYIGSTPMNAKEFNIKCCISSTRYDSLKRVLEIWNKRNG